MEKNNWAQVQSTLANCLLAAGIVIVFITITKIKTSLEIAMIFASTTTLFYFWWGYIFLAQKGMESKRIIDYFYDFVIIMLLVGLFYITGNESEKKSITWLSIYFSLFVATILKYVFLLNTQVNKVKIKFIKQKINTDSTAAFWIALFLIIAVFVKLELFAIWGIFLMEFVHIIYVGIFTKFYENI